jgi:hypothetical protein
MGLEAHKHLKKVLSLMCKLDFIVDLDRSGCVMGYKSGKNEQQLFQYIDNGMYQMLVVGAVPSRMYA